MDVFGWSYCFEVFWVHTATVLAQVVYLIAARDYAFIKFVVVAMSLFAFVVGANAAVAVVLEGSYKVPTGCFSVHFVVLACHMNIET